MIWRALRVVVTLALIFAVIGTIASVITSLVSTWREEELAGTPLQMVFRREDDPVLIEAFLSNDQPASMEHVRCWFQVRTTSKGKLENVRLINWHAPGFRGLTFVQSTPFTFVSKKGVAAGPLKFNMTAEFSWALNGIAHRRVVELGPIVINDHQPQQPQKISAAYLGYMKDLALPLFVAWLTIAGGYALKQAEWDRTAREAVLERVRNSAGNLRLASKARSIALRFDSIRAKTDEDLTPNDFDLATHAVLQLFSTTRELIDRSGGYILPGREGEEIVALSQGLFYRLINDVVEMEERTRAVKHVSPSMDFADFKDDALSRPTVRHFHKQLEEWLRSGDPDVPLASVLMGILCEVLNYEINVAYISSTHDEWQPLISDRDLQILESSGKPDAQVLVSKVRKYQKRHRQRRRF